MKLVDILGTKYISANWAQDIDYIVRNLISGTEEAINVYEEPFRELLKQGEPYVIDLADARICKDVMVHICNYTSDKIKLIDSSNSYREAILRENETRRTLNYETVHLPGLSELNDLLKYIPALDEDIVYDVQTMPLEEALRLVTIITAYRPDVHIDMGTHYEDLFQFVASLLHLSSYKCTKVLYIVGTTFAKADVVDDKVYITGYGNMSWDTFINTFTCVPYEFGTECLITRPEWYEVVKNCCLSLPNFLKHRTTITDYFKMED